MKTQLRINSQFNGPDESGNGGYSCGVFAKLLHPGPNEAVEVTLHSPPPLNKNIYADVNNRSLEVTDGHTLIATAKPGSLDLTIPAPPTMQQAERASKHYIGFSVHKFPRCFVCGPGREVGDGLRIFAGSLANELTGSPPTAGVACSWQPFEQLADGQGCIASEFIWAALDCPSYFAATVDNPETVALLGRLTLQFYQPNIQVEQRYIISAWPIARSGRKLLGGAALFGLQGKCLAAAKATWITISQ